ncbi:MAG TPA: hypothetical protein VM936_18065 [Pyrinomonadaceae bacterium]|jgi:hypothetical protein|nr:hypothetical protein [Pyrinomonadaceae bacterium]
MHTRTRGRALAIAFAFALLVAGRGVAAAQDGGESSNRQQQAAARAETNFEVQTHVLVATEGAGTASKVPQALDGVVRQLKSILPPADYGLAATFVNRVKDDGGFDVRSAGASPFGSPQTGPLTPNIFQLSLALKAFDGASGERYVRVQPFKLGLKIPIQTATVGGDKPGQSYPVIQYEDTGINTQMSVREGEPTLVGTLNTSRPGQLFVIVITVRRVGR